MSVSVSGLVLLKAVFDFYMSVSAASSVQKMQITCLIMYTGNILGTMSVSGFFPEKS